MFHAATLLEALRAAAHRADEFKRLRRVAIFRRGQFVMHGQSHDFSDIINRPHGQRLSKRKCLKPDGTNAETRRTQRFAEAEKPNALRFSAFSASLR